VPENYNNVTYQLKEEGNDVVFTVIQEGLRDEETRKHSEENWGVIIEDMKKLVEEGA
jgi:hypothetical protein